MRVHVTIDRGVIESTGADSILEQASAHGLRVAPDQPLLRFGILRGEIDPDRVQALEKMTGVKAVEADTRRKVV